MRKKTIILAVLLLVVHGIGYAFQPPPPPPVNQNIGIYDAPIDFLITNTTDQNACRYCHQTSGTNISGGYNNTIGGVPTRHHNMLSEGIINPYTNVPFGCTDCHPSIPGVGNGILLDRSCQDCHNGTSFWGNSIGGHVGNFSRPHHINTTYDDANIGNPAANRTCNFCHGSFVDNYNDGHYVPSYNTTFMISPYATFKITNFSEPNPITVFDSFGNQVLNKTWGGCESCHLATLMPRGCLGVYPTPTMSSTATGTATTTVTQTIVPTQTACPQPGRTPNVIGSILENHHKEILGFSEFGDTIPLQNTTTPFNVNNVCSVCHVIDSMNLTGNGNTFPLIFNTTNPFTGENITNATEIRNSTIEQADAAIGAFEPGTTNITINGTGCEKCHSVRSIHNIQFNYSQNGPQGFGHINNNSDCYGCHNSWLPADTWIPGPLIPTIDSIMPSVITVGTATTLSITGTNFINPDGNYTSVVKIDGVTYIPSSETATQISINIPALNAGVHQLQLVKGGDTLSKLLVLTIVPNPIITSATLNKGTITITGSGFGSKPTNATMYVSVNHAGNQIMSTSVSKWNDNQITAKNSVAVSGDILTVLTANAGEAVQKIQ